MKYQVECGYRHADKFPAQTTLSTRHMTVTVEAETIEDARLEAINGMYALFGETIEHVKPGRVTAVQQ